MTMRGTPSTRIWRRLISIMGFLLAEGYAGWPGERAGSVGDGDADPLAAGRVRPDHEHDLAGVHAPGQVAAEVAELVGGDGEPGRAGLAGLEVQPRPVEQFDVGPGDLCDRVAEVQLDDLAAGALTGVGDLHADLERPTRAGQL